MKARQTQTDGWSPSLESAVGTLGKRIAKTIKAMGKKLLPEVIIEEVSRYRAYPEIERPIYLKMRIMNAVGLANPKRLRPPKTARSFLFVCFGNIMRSPMCEALMHRALAAIPSGHISVSSAGLNATPGTPAHPWAIAAARELGVPLENHRARLLTSEMVNEADAIFAMDYQNQVQLLSRFPRAMNKVFMLSAYAGEDYLPFEIHDPYYSGEAGTRACYSILSTCVQNLASSLSSEE